MRKLCFTSAIVVLLQFCINGVLAQATDTKLDQMELFKIFFGIWKGELTKDTVMIMNFTSYGKAVEDNYQIVTKDKALSRNPCKWLII